VDVNVRLIGYIFAVGVSESVDTLAPP